MQLVGAVAELAHLAEHQPAHAAERAERIEARPQRAGIGVVRVVDQERAVQRRLQLETSGDALHRGQAGDDLVELDADRARGGGRAECIAQVVQTAERERRGLAAVRRDELEVGAEPTGVALRAHLVRHEIGRLLEPERQHALRGARIAPLRRERVVGIDDRDAFGGQRAEHLALALRDAGEAAESFQVRRARVGHDADGRLRETREVRDLADVIRAHLDDGVAMLGRQLQQHQRHADVIVEIAARDQRLALARQDRADQLLRGRLAVAAGDADQRNVELPSPLARECRQRAERIGCHDLRDLRSERALDDRGGRTALRGRCDEVVAVEARTAQRDEQRAGLQRARIGGDAAERAVVADDLPGCVANQLAQAPRHHERCSSTARATSRSLKRRRSVPTI